jgi:hypothetical protein
VLDDAPDGAAWLNISGRTIDEAQAKASEWGIDLQHVADHLLETALCTVGGNPDLLTRGLFIQFHTTNGMTWTFTIMPTYDGRDS